MERTVLYLVAAVALLMTPGLAAAGPDDVPVAGPVAGPDTGTVKLGLNYPRTGPCRTEGLDQYRAAMMAVEEVNAAGGVLGRQVELVCRDSRSNSNRTRENVTDLVKNADCRMVFGGSSSAAAIAAGEVCQQNGVPFFGTLTYSTSTTGIRGHRYMFRECYDSWMGAGVVAEFLETHYADSRYMYITADYAWGRSTERSLRSLTETEDTEVHKGLLTPLDSDDLGVQLSMAKMLKPDVLVLVLFGRDMVHAIRQATAMGIKENTQIVVPSLTLGMAEAGGADVMEGVVGALPWCWQVPYEFDYPKGKAFVEKFAARHDCYPSTSGASAYTIVHEYKAAVERAGNWDGAEVVRALEGHHYTSLKGEQYWRDFDHQSVQTVYVVRCKPESEVLADKLGLDYFEILSSLDGERATIAKNDWASVRRENGLPGEFEPISSVASR